MTRSVNPRKSVLVLSSILGLLFACARANADAGMNIDFIKIQNIPADTVVLQGAQIEISFSVTNQGDLKASSYIVHCGLRQNQDYGSPYKCTLGTISRGSLAPGKTDTFTWTATLPDDCPRDRYYIYARIECAEDPDSMAYVRESPVFRILVPRPDLRVYNVAIGVDVCPPGGVLPLTVSVENLGGVACTNYHMDYCVGSICIASADRGALGRNSLETFEVECVVPRDFPEGDYPVKANANCAGNDRPAGNTGTAVKSILIHSYSDLRLRRVEAGARTCSPDGQLTVRSVVENIGTCASDAYTVRYYISPDTSITIKDQCIGSETSDALEKGAQRNHETTCQLPPYVPEGDCYVGAIVTCANDGSPRNDSGLDPVPVAVVHPAGYVCGRITYSDLDGGGHPVRYALIRAYGVDDNSNPMDDPVMREAYTDADGNYGNSAPKEW